MSKISFLLLCLVAISLNSVHATTREAMAAFQAHTLPLAKECSKEYGLTLDDLNAAAESNNPDAVNPCFMGCVFKKANIFNSEGKLDLEPSLKELKKLVSNEEDYNKLAEVGKDCLSVNEQAVSDGDAGCERARLFMVCYSEHMAVGDV